MIHDESKRLKIQEIRAPVWYCSFEDLWIRRPEGDLVADRAGHDRTDRRFSACPLRLT